MGIVHLYHGSECSMPRVQFWKRGETWMVTDIGVHSTLYPHIRDPIFPKRPSFPLFIIYMYRFTFAGQITSIPQYLFFSLRYASPFCPDHSRYETRDRFSLCIIFNQCNFSPGGWAWWTRAFNKTRWTYQG